MEQIKALNSKEKKEIARMIKDQWGCDYGFETVYLNTKNKIFILSNFDLDLSRLRVNSLGLYFGEIYDERLRLSLEGSQIIGKIAKKNVIALSDGQAADWLDGQDMMVDTDMEGFVIVKNDDDFLGCGKIFNKKLYNYVPKERRVHKTL